MIDDDGHAWTLVASTDKGNQIASAAGNEAPQVEEYSANVAKLGIGEVEGVRRVCQENADGDQYWTTGPQADWTKITPPPAPIPAGQYFTAKGGELYKPDGSLWKPTGMNLSVGDVQQSRWWLESG